MLRGLCLIGWGCALSLAAAEPEQTISYLGGTTIPGTAEDLSGLTEILETGVPQNRLGAFGSAIDATTTPDEYLVLPDRGPNDGAASYRIRLHRMHISYSETDGVTARVLKTIFLTGRDGQPLSGHSQHFAPTSTAEPLRFDPEGIRVTPHGTYLISEEYGPSLMEFAADGTWLRSFSAPAGFTIQTPATAADAELPPHNTRGRQTNRGWEGLALTPDGKTAWVMLQSPLLQDHALNDDLKRVGRNIRLTSFDTATAKATGQHVYVLEDPSQGVNEILAASATTAIVLERDNKGGTAAKFKRLYRIDLTAATDVSQVNRLPKDTLPAYITPVRKTLLLDLLDDRWGLAESMPEKTEGLAWGPILPDGRRTLIVTSDNDFIAEQPSRIDLFAVPRD
jgi:hypothetical protein